MQIATKPERALPPCIYAETFRRNGGDGWRVCELDGKTVKAVRMLKGEVINFQFAVESSWLLRLAFWCNENGQSGR